MVWNIWTIFPYTGNVIIPTDFHIFQRGRSQPPTSNFRWHRITWWSLDGSALFPVDFQYLTPQKIAFQTLMTWQDCRWQKFPRSCWQKHDKEIEQAVATLGWCVMVQGKRSRSSRRLASLTIKERLENDRFFMSPCCDFLPRLGTCLSPDTGRSFEAREKGKGTEIRTRLVFMPIPDRDTSTPLDVSTEAMVCHSGRFYTLAQLAVFTSKLALVGPVWAFAQSMCAKSTRICAIVKGSEGCRVWIKRKSFDRPFKNMGLWVVITNLIDLIGQLSLCHIFNRTRNLYMYYSG